MKKIKLLVVALMAIILLPFNINAAEKDPINVYMFKGDGCGYCAAALEFFESIEDEYGKYFDLVEYEVWYDENNATLMTEVASYFGEEVGGVPYIVIGETTFQGYAENYNEQIKTAIIEEYNNDDYIDAIKAVNGGETSSSEKEDDSNKTTIIIIAVAVIGFIALFYFARDNEVEEVEDKETKVVEKPKKEEVKKTAPKKTSAKKTATTKKTTTAKKTTTTKTSASKKTTTTKKAPAKTTTKK